MEQDEKTISKKDRTIIKCKDCGFKYYEGNIHVCPGVSVIEERELRNAKDSSHGEEKPKEKKVVVKFQKESFKIWKND